MTSEKDTSWTELQPPLRSNASRKDFADFARALARVRRDEKEEAIDQLRRSFADLTKSSTRAERQALLAAGLVLADLAMQGWQMRVRLGHVEVRPPVQLSDDRAAEKARIRRQELVKRDGQR